jgi:hypothetical protein
VPTLTCIPSFCCNSGSNRKTQPCYWLATNKTPGFCCNSRINRKTQPCYWLATNNNTRRKQKTEKHNRIDKTHRKGQQRRTKIN